MVHSDKQWEIIILLLMMECTIVQKKQGLFFPKVIKKEGAIKNRY